MQHQFTQIINYANITSNYWYNVNSHQWLLYYITHCFTFTYINNTLGDDLLSYTEVLDSFLSRYTSSVHTLRVQESPEQAIQSVTLLIVGRVWAAVPTKKVWRKIDHTWWTETVAAKVLATKNRKIAGLTIAIRVAGKGILWERELQP